MTPEADTLETAKPQPRKGKKQSSAASVVAQAKAKIAQDGKIGSITHARIERALSSKSGEPMLTVIFPARKGREPQHLDVSFLLGFPNLQQMFSEAILSWGSNLSPKTRVENINSLRRHFFAYLERTWSNLLRPEDIDDEILVGFKESLLNKSGARAKPLHPTTVSSSLSDLRSVLGAITTGPWKRVANYIAERVPPGPRGADKKSEPTAVLGLEHLLEIIEAAEREVLAIERRFAHARVLLADGPARLIDANRIMSNTRNDYGDLATCLAAVADAYPGVIPKMKVVKATHRTLAGALQNIHGLSTIESYLYTSPRDLVPFVLLLAIATVFNPETILGLSWRDIDFDKDQAGTPAFEIIGRKGRAAKDPVRLLDPEAAASSQLSLKQMLVCLQEITSRIRPHLAREHASDVFVFVPGNSTKAPKGFGLDSPSRVVLKSGDRSWMVALRDFIKSNSLRPFTLGQLRPSILDLVQFMDGSLEAARKVGNHSNPVTTWTHYTSSGVKARYRERIGQIIILRERWLETNGVIDPRRLAPGQDKGAATPGFSCLDPFDSPRPNQQRGKLCKDYGGCPACPMAAAHPSDPLCVTYYTALEIAIYRSQATMSAKTWVERWAPVLADLAALLAWIPQDVLVASREISIQLPNVG